MTVGKQTGAKTRHCRDTTRTLPPDCVCTAGKVTQRRGFTEHGPGRSLDCADERIIVGNLGWLCKRQYTVEERPRDLDTGPLLAKCVYSAINVPGKLLFR